MSYDGEERRKDNISLDARVRDLEEETRASAKSRQAMHKQLGDLSVKVDLVLSRMDEKAVDCAEHKTKLALVEQAHDVLTITVEKMAIAIKEIKDDQKLATQAAAAGLGAGILTLLGYIWNHTVGK